MEKKKLPQKDEKTLKFSSQKTLAEKNFLLKWVHLTKLNGKAIKIWNSYIMCIEDVGEATKIYYRFENSIQEVLVKESNDQILKLLFDADRAHKIDGD